AFAAAVFRHISAALALEKVDEYLTTVTGDEKLSLLFLKCRILSSMNKIAEHKKLIEFIKKEHPNAFAKQNLDVAFLIEELNKMKTQWSRSKAESEQGSIQLKIKGALRNLKTVLEEKVAAVEKLEAALTSPKDQYRADVIAAKRARDNCDFNYGAGLYFLALTYKENSQDRLDYLKSAELAIDDFTIQCENCSVELLGRAYNLFGLILLEQGKIDKALEEFEILKEYRTSFGTKFRAEHPEIAKEIIKLEEITQINAYRNFAKACFRKKALALAIKELRSLREVIPGNLNYVEGLLARFELTEYLASAGRVTEALEELDPILKRPEAVRIANLSKEALRDEARKALASISDAAGGAIFSPELQFQAGLGYQIRGDDEAAIVGYKGVLTSAVTQEERAKWVPKACQEMARLLYHQERYLEAALAFCILANEFPTHPEAPMALKKAKKALSKAIKSHGEDDAMGPIHDVQKKIERTLLNRGDSDTKINILLKRAAKLEAKRKYLEAAREYLSVPEFVTKTEKKTTPCQHYAIALARAGYCYSRDSQSNNSPQSPLRALELLKQARQVALSRDDKRAAAAASYYLGDLANFKKDFKKALQYLAFLDNTPKAASFRILARAQQVTAHMALGQFAKAEACYNDVSASRSPSVAVIALKLADGFAQTAREESLKKNPVKAELQRSRMKAADYASDWISRSKKLSRSSLLWAASLIMDGQRYEKAVSVYERLFKEFPRPKINGKLLGKKAQEESALHDQYDLARMNLARAFLIVGKATEAANLFTELKAQVVLKKKNTLIARGQFIKEARETLRDDKGRPVRCRVYYI
ncbi:MAG: hypothetical protein P1V97_38525, partial [Planctomycetota bacterium]|nr:hypothetical protein [Planctomycetota bacterium]